MDHSSTVVALEQPLLESGGSGNPNTADGSSPRNDREASIASTSSQSSQSSPASTTNSLSAHSQPAYYSHHSHNHKSFPDSYNSPSDTDRSLHDATLSRLHGLKLSMDESGSGSGGSAKSFASALSPHTAFSPLNASGGGGSDRGGELHRPLFSGYGADSWQRQPPSGIDSPYAISPASGRRQIRSAAVGDNAPYRELSGGGQASAVNRDVSVQELERLLGAAAQQYSVALVPALTSVQHAPSSPASAYVELLKLEGCALCLSHRDLVDEQSSSNTSPRYAVLTSQVLLSKHIAHLSCLLSALHSHASNASSPSSPRLDLAQSSYTSRIVPLSHHSSRYHAPLPTDMSGSRRFTVDLCLVHACSNVQQTHMAWPSIVSTYQASDERQYLFLSLTSPLDDSSESPLSGLPTSSTSAPSSPALSATAPVDLVRFTALRGKLLFRCVDVTTQESFEHIVPYDLSPFAVQPGSTRERHVLRLLHSDMAVSRNVLTVAIHRSRDGRGFAVSYVRYDLRPNFTVPSYWSELALPLPVASSPLKSPTAADFPASFSASATPFVPTFASQQPGDVLGAGRLTLQSEHEDFHSSLHSSPAVSPFPKSRHFASAPVSSAPSPVPSSRNISYAALNSPSHSQLSVGVESQQQQQQQQRLLSRQQQKPTSSSTNSAMHSARASPNSFSRPLNARASPGGYYGGGQGNEWDSGSVGGDAGGGGGGGDELDGDEDDNDEAFDSYEHRDRLSQLHSHNNHSNNRDFHNGHPTDPSHEQSPLFLPALPTFPTTAPPGLQQVNLGPNPLLTLTVDAVRGNVMRLVKSHAGSRFVQQKLDSRDVAFFNLFYEEMCDHVPELMVDNFSHFAIEKLITLSTDEQCLTLLQRLAPAIAVVACQKHGSFSVQALVDTLHTPAQVYTLVESMKADIMRIITHASGHFVILRMLQRFPYNSTKFIDDAITNNVGVVATDHHGLRVFKAVLCVRRPAELTRLFKQVARMTMKLVENQYGNYSLQAVLDVAPPGVRTNIKVKMEGKYMRLSKQKFSSNVVEKCLKQSSCHWRTIIIRELIAQPAVAELLRDRYGNYVLQTALSVANAQQVSEIVRAITPYLASLRDNVRSKWKKMLKKAHTAVAKGGLTGSSGGGSGGGSGSGDGERDEQGEPLSPDPRQGTEDEDGEDGGVDGEGDVAVFSTDPSPHGNSPSFNYHQLASPSSHFQHQQQQQQHNVLQQTQLNLFNHQSATNPAANSGLPAGLLSAPNNLQSATQLLNAFAPMNLNGLGLYNASSTAASGLPFGGGSGAGGGGMGGGGGGYGMFGLGSTAGVLGGGQQQQQLHQHFQHQQQQQQQQQQMHGMRMF